MSFHDDNPFGYIYDWMEETEAGLGSSWDIPEYPGIGSTTEEYSEFFGESNIGYALAEEYMGGDAIESGSQGVSYVSPSWFQEEYGNLFQAYNPTQERLDAEGFGLQVKQSGKKMGMKTLQEERDVALESKYYGVDTEDDFESLVELDIRHKGAEDAEARKLFRQKTISESIDLHRNKKKLQDKAILNSLRSGKVDVLAEEIEGKFWDDMKVVRSSYDKTRVKRDQLLQKIIVEAEQKVEGSIVDAQDSLALAFTKAAGTMKNEALELLSDKLEMREDYEEGLWEILGTLAAEDALIPCSGGKPMSYMQDECHEVNYHCDYNTNQWQALVSGNLCAEEEGDDLIPDDPSLGDPSIFGP